MNHHFRGLIMNSLIKIVSFAGLALFALCLLAGPLRVQAQPHEITLYITDFGINQWNEDLELSQDFRNASNRVFPDLPSEAQILIPMSADAANPFQSEQSLRSQIADAVTSKVEAGLDHGVTTFEIQLVQNINSMGYSNSDRQDLVNAFGKTAYRAIGDAIATLQARGIDVSGHAIAGSNGAKVLTENVDSLYIGNRIYLDGVDLFDGRAFLTPAQDLIEAIGPGKVRIFNTRGDYPAPYTPIGFRSIGSFDTSVDLKDAYPNLKTYLLAPVGMSRRFGSAHVAGMRLPGAQFAVSEYLGDGYLLELDRPFTGSDLRPGRVGSQGSSTLDRQFPGGAIRPSLGKGAQEFIRANRERVVELATAVFSYADVLKEAHGKALEQIPFFRNTKLSPREQAFLKAGKYLATVNGLSEAINQDLDDQSHGSYVFLRSKTLEALGRFGLETMVALKLDEKLPPSSLTKGLLTRVGGFQELVTGLAKQAGSVEADLDVVTHYVDGIKALAKVELEGRGKLTGRFALLDGFQELATAGYRHSRQKRLDVDLVTQYLDAANNLAWTGLGLAACGGHHGCTAAIQTFGTAVAKAARGGTLGLFQRGVLLLRRQDQTVIDQWRVLQQRNIASGMPVQKISDVYGTELLKQNGLTGAQIRELDRVVDELGLGYPQGPAKAGVDPGKELFTKTQPQGAEDERGGVDLAVDAPAVTETDLSAIRRSVLEQRPLPGRLARDLDP